MKKRFLIVTAILFICSTFIWNVPAQAKSKNYLMDKSKVYTYSYYYYEGKKKITDNSSFKYMKSEDFWDSKDGGEIFEQQKKNYYSFGHGYVGSNKIPRNAKVGDKIYDDYKPKNYKGKVTSVTATVKTKAGTFKNCIVVQFKGLKRYFAPNNGLVLWVYSKENITFEVIKISKK